MASPRPLRRSVALTACGLLACMLSLTPAAGQRQVVAPPAAVLDLPFSPAVWNGDLLMLSGAIANEPGTTTVKGNVFVQSRKTFDNLEVVLKAAGLSFDDVVQVDAYLSDMRNFSAYNKIFHQTMETAQPVRTTVEADIAIPGALTEISMIAVKPGVERRAVTPDGWLDQTAASWGILVGDTFLMSGMASIDPTTGREVAGSAEEQVQRAMENMGTLLKAAGMTHDNVVSCRVYLADGRDFQALNKIYPEFFRQAPPARATVRARTVDQDLLVEIQCTAAHGKRRRVLPEGGKLRYTLSQAIEVGDELYLSGMVGRNSEGVFPPGVAAQTQVVLDNLEATLLAAGLTFDDVTDANVYLTDIRTYGEMNKVYAAALNKPAPARATVGTVLMSPEALVEIQMHARRPAAAPAAPAAPE